MKKSQSHYISHMLPAIAAAVVMVAMVTACSGNTADKPHNFPVEVKEVAESIMSDSAPAFASSVTYPLDRPYPLKNIADSAEMVKYYPVMVDDSLRNAVHEAPDSLWSPVGWRGWTLGDGRYFWIDGGRIYAMNYLSRRERFMLDSLRRAEIATLDPSMRTGWTPVGCVVDSVSGTLFRIDSRPDSVQGTELYRLALYNSDRPLDGAPSMVLYGRVDIEGSMGNRFYHFADSTGTVEADYSPDIVSDTDTVPVVEVGPRHRPHRYHARPAYWLDHVKSAK